MTTTSIAGTPASTNTIGDLDIARRLVALGVPVFHASLTPDGSPLRASWQFIEPHLAEVDQWRPGLALCASMGAAFDVLDVDPRNGGSESLARLLAELGDSKPTVYAKATTPSGGWHYWIAALGIGKHTNFWPGLDLQGGRPGGGSRGLAFIPPTVRPSKVTGELLPYRWIEAPSAAPADDSSGSALAAIIRASAKSNRGAPPGRQPADPGTVLGSARNQMAGILTAVLEAQEGERNRLLFWAACKATEMVAAGDVAADTAASFLAEAASRIGLPADEAARTIASGMRAVSA